MQNPHPFIKLDFFPGLQDVVRDELLSIPDITIRFETSESFYLDYLESFASLRNLRSVLRVHIGIEHKTYTPRFINNHKSVLGNLITSVLQSSSEKWQTFRIVCAGSDSPEVRAIAEYVTEHFSLTEAAEADLKIYLIKPTDTWEVAVEITPRPLSVRPYKIQHMSGAMDPTIAYAVNQYAALENANSYVNIFSGSATLLLEAAQCYPHLEKLVGFDNNKKHLSLAMQNIKGANLQTRIQLLERDILDLPDLGTFDVITSDMPFGMSIAKGEDLEAMYQSFVRYCEQTLSPTGRLIAYTSQTELLENILQQSSFTIEQTIELRYHAYLKPKIFVCTLV